MTAMIDDVESGAGTIDGAGANRGKPRRRPSISDTYRFRIVAFVVSMVHPASIRRFADVHLCVGPRGGVVSESNTSATDSVADSVDDTVDENPWLERSFQIGWIAKSIVYIVMGVAATQIARLDAAAEGEASPEGSVGMIADVPVGRLILAVLTVGLLLYVVWRVLSVAVIRGNGVEEWADRVGYTFSGIFYVLLAYTAGKASFTGLDPEESNTVESLSKAVMEIPAGRTMVGIAGLAIIGVGLYFAIHKGIQRSFIEDLNSVRPHPTDNERKRGALVIAGVVGWIGRGVVTVLVGFFVVRSAWRFDADDARGFDQSLRQVAGTGVGSTLVLAAAIGLIAYGIFCFASHRFRTLED